MLVFIRDPLLFLDSFYHVVVERKLIGVNQVRTHSVANPATIISNAGGLGRGEGTTHSSLNRTVLSS